MFETLLFHKLQVERTVDRLAGEIAAWLQSLPSSRLNLLCVLEGARPFARDLTANLKRRMPGLELKPHEIRIQGTNGTTLLVDRQMRSPLPSEEDLLPGPLLIVDDLVDSGLTLKILRKGLEPLAPAGVKTAVLIRKFGESSGPVDFCGFDLDLNLEKLAQDGLKDYWLFGYGMDLDGRQRDLDYIGRVEIR